MSEENIFSLNPVTQIISYSILWSLIPCINELVVLHRVSWCDGMATKKDYQNLKDENTQLPRRLHPVNRIRTLVLKCLEL